MKRVTSACAWLKKMMLPPPTRQKIAKRLERDFRSGTASFKLCDGIKEIRSQALIQINEALNLPEEQKPMNNTVSKTFKLHPDQKEIVEGALEHVKRKTGTKVDTVALELICQQYMGTGIAFPTLEAAMNAEFKKSATPEEFAGKVVGMIHNISGLTLTLAD